MHKMISMVNNHMMPVFLASDEEPWAVTWLMPRSKHADSQIQQRIASRVRQARRDRGLTQEQLAEALDVATETVSRYEGGRLPPSLPMLFRLADALGVDIEVLVRRGPSEPNSAEAELVDGWRSLDSEERQMVLHLVRRLSRGIVGAAQGALHIANDQPRSER